MKLYLNYLLFFVLIGGLTTACTATKLEILQPPAVQRNPNPAAPLGAILKFSTTDTVSVQIDCISEGHSFMRVFTNVTNPEEGLPIIGLKPGRIYTINLKIQSGKRAVEYVNQIQYTTRPLPEDPYAFPRFTVKKTEGLPMEEGITLFNPRRNTPPGSGRQNDQLGMLVAVDSQGEVVWYYRTDSRISDFNYLPNGHISYLTADHRLIEIDLLGNVLHTWYAAERPGGPIEGATAIASRAFHHDATLLPNGNYLILGSEIKELTNYYTSEEDKNAPRKTQQVMGDVLLEFEPDGKVVWEWHAFDHLDPYRIGYETFSEYWYTRGYPGVVDWSHANTILYDPRDSSVIMNSRYLSALYKINRKDSSIEWIFGEPTGLSDALREKSVQLKNGDWFWHQHSPSFTPNGTVLIFNNDNYRAWPFDQPEDTNMSYAVEYRIHEDSLTAEQVWSSKLPKETGIKSLAMGDVDYLPQTGNILVSYGFLRENEKLGHQRNWSMIREFTHDSIPQVVWELQLWPSKETHQDSVGWAIFSAERLPALK